MEYKKEPMYHLIYDAAPFASFHMQDIYGCSHCFFILKNSKNIVIKKYIEPTIQLSFGVEHL